MIQADGTVMFGNVTTGGTELTLNICVRQGKPYIVNPTAEDLRQWLIDS
ncbi:hypothetical protein GO755_19775 [Spirosoma sp. HMF4905]|uniref:Uncharacterized protein n=1 Tax=Spirosoma arboris TaxID=2682092 RepID=A0A7K1SFE8_9BACT|nr:hypothetical protein [Spirosoma arboris]